jgi:hypothetical protein
MTSPLFVDHIFFLSFLNSRYVTYNPI